jgi:hypothetical protein
MATMGAVSNFVWWMDAGGNVRGGPSSAPPMPRILIRHAYRWRGRRFVVKYDPIKAAADALMSMLTTPERDWLRLRAVEDGDGRG